MHLHQPIVSELIALLQARPDLETALQESLRRADQPGIATIRQYLDFLNGMVTLIPTDRNLNAMAVKFFYLIDLSPDGVLKSDASFQEWTHKFATDWGNFLDTPESARGITSFFADPAYHIDDYCFAPSGWLTFNQFFARHVRPGKRPVDGRNDASTIVSPADSVYQGQWPIDADSQITAKGLTWSVVDLLAGSPYQDRFHDGARPSQAPPT